MVTGIVNYTLYVCRQYLWEGYYSTDFFCETFSVTASNQVIKVIKGYANFASIITIYTPFNLLKSGILDLLLACGKAE